MEFGRGLGKLEPHIGLLREVLSNGMRVNSDNKQSVRTKQPRNEDEGQVMLLTTRDTNKNQLTKTGQRHKADFPSSQKPHALMLFQQK